MSQEALIWLNGLPKGEVRLKPTARRLLECLALHHRHETGCYISQARLANEAVVSRGTVNNCLNILEREGLIARERRGSPARGVMQTTRYHFPFEPSFERFKRPQAVLGGACHVGRVMKTSDGAAFVPPTVQELDASFRNQTERKEIFHPDQFVAHCLDACGPGLCTASRRMITDTNDLVIGWLKAGYSLQKDILPTLRKRTSRPRTKEIRTWAYFTKAIAEAHYRRTLTARGGIETKMGGKG